MWFQPSALLGWAHPRVGGENIAGLGGAAAVGGSSPRRRGKRTAPAQRNFEGRLIPA